MTDKTNLQKLQDLILEEQHKMMKTIVTAMAENEDDSVKKLIPQLTEVVMDVVKPTLTDALVSIFTEEEAETIIEFREKLNTKLESFSQLCHIKYAELGGEIEKAIDEYVSQLPDENDTSEKLH